MSRYPDEFAILHVDDDPQLLALSKQFLTSKDDRLTVETVSDPTEVLELIATNEYDAIISDYQMPNLTGLELLERVRTEQGLSVPFIIFTGEGREAVASEALNLGADRYLQKGGDPASQYTVLANAVIDEVEHARAKSSLQATTEKYAGVYENAPLAFVIWNQAGTVVDWNDRAEALFGWSSDEARGQQLHELLVPPNESEAFAALSQPLLTDGVPTDRVVETVTKTGQRVVCHWYNTPLENTDSEVDEVLSMILDITASREQEATLKRYATAVKGSDDSIYMLDTDGQYVFANTEHLSRLAADGKIKQADESEVVGRKYVDIHNGPNADRITNILQEVIETGEPKTEEYEFQTEDSWSYRTYSPVADPETDEPVGVVVISKDITQRKRLEARETFLSSLLRHDVKNKINTAEGYVELASREDSSPAAMGYLDTATRALSGSLELIEKVGMLSELAQENTGPWELNGVLSTVVDTYTSQAAAEDVTLEFEGCEGTVHGGPLLEALFGNLLANALTHSNADTIEIRCRREGDEYVVVVDDDGDGLPTDDASMLFKQGVSLGESAGTGLGLYLVSEIAESYGGQVSLASSDEGGLRVVIRLQAA